MNKKEKRFVCHARIHVRDSLFGNAMVCTYERLDDSAIALFEDASGSIEKYINTISKDEEPTPKRIKKHIEQLKGDGWGNKRIINHFAKFGIAVDIPEKKSEEKKLPDGQKTLGSN
ncbi:unnamed protein product [marine sediment metagenome]|uniref:Uncharacterized protein n=1 Tax=marine sediment metagenome TaxID=412755 RepID=X1FHA4_9ZZZZ